MAKNISSLPTDLLADILSWLFVLDRIECRGLSKDFLGIVPPLSKRLFTDDRSRLSYQHVSENMALNDIKLFSKFYNNANGVEKKADLEEWVNFLRDQGVEELKLSGIQPENEIPAVPEMLFRVETLTTLHLGYSSTRVPLLAHLPNLIDLKLQLNSDDQFGDIEALLTNSPKLRRVHLEFYLWWADHFLLRVHHTTLAALTLRGLSLPELRLLLATPKLQKLQMNLELPVSIGWDSVFHGRVIVTAAANMKNEVDQSLL